MEVDHLQQMRIRESIHADEMNTIRIEHTIFQSKLQKMEKSQVQEL